jgi:hypothetical protein
MTLLEEDGIIQDMDRKIENLLTSQVQRMLALHRHYISEWTGRGSRSINEKNLLHNQRSLWVPDSVLDKAWHFSSCKVHWFDYSHVRRKKLPESSIVRLAYRILCSDGLYSMIFEHKDV